MAVVNALFLLTHLNAFTEKCSIYDTPCLASLAQNYVTSFFPGGTGFGLEPVDPMCLDPINGVQDGLVYSLSEIEVVGLKNTLVEKVQYNKIENRVYYKFRTPRVTIFANFTTEGFITPTVPFNGKGRVIFNLYDFENELTINYETFKDRNDKNYLNCKNYLYWFDFRYIETYFENLNNDDPVKAAQNYLKTEGKKVWQQYGRSLLDKVNDKIFIMAQKIYMLQPTENYYIDY